MDKNVQQIHEALLTLSQSKKFNGSVLASVQSEVIFAQGFGMADFECSANNKASTQFRIASITKSFTAIAVLQLVERGLIQLEDRLDRYFPNQYGANGIRVFHLLTHTSGIPDYMEDADLMSWIGNSSEQADLINRFKSRPLEFIPGQRYKYSNSGYVLLGALIEKITGRPYQEYFKEYIFQPAEMFDTGIEEVPGKRMKEQASGYQLDETGALQNAPTVHMSNAHAAGSIVSTVKDLNKWDQALDSNLLLSAGMKEKMWSPSVEATGFSYGYGWIIQNSPFGKLIGHSGGIHGFSSIFLKYIDVKVTVIVLSNMFLPVDEVGRDIAALIHS